MVLGITGESISDPESPGPQLSGEEGNEPESGVFKGSGLWLAADCRGLLRKLRRKRGLNSELANGRLAMMARGPGLSPLLQGLGGVRLWDSFWWSALRV